MGSLLWTLESRPINEESLREAEQFAKEALGWLLTAGLATMITVRAFHAEADQERISIDVTLTQGALTTTYVVST